jgi:photosynthetic reaction center cytochrome c subunit
MNRLLTTLGVLLAAAVLAGCERPPPQSVQHGYRGTGMVQVYNPRTLEQQVPLNQPPAALPAAPDAGPRAKDIYQNVQVLGDLSITAFTRHMASITQWVAPNEGCAYCHNLENLADDGKYTKVVARAMIRMTQEVNAEWKPHVAATGVTCWTCHRGQHIPQQVWFKAVPQDQRAGFIGNRNGQNAPAPAVGLASLPMDPFSAYLDATPQPIRVGGTTALPTGHVASIQATEGTYALMMHMSTSLGVNCTYCHNTRNFAAWDQSTGQRVTAWHGLRMVSAINERHLLPLTDTFPPARKGPQGDVAKASCATCHQGAYKPVYGAPMAKDFPELLGPVAAPMAPASTAAAPSGVVLR